MEDYSLERRELNLTREGETHKLTVGILQFRQDTRRIEHRNADERTGLGDSELKTTLILEREGEDRDELFVSRLWKPTLRPRRYTYLSSTNSAWDFVNIPFAWHRCIDCRWSPLVIRRRYTRLEGNHTLLAVVLPNLNPSISPLSTPTRSFPNLISRCLCECILRDCLRILRRRILKSNQMSIWSLRIRSVTSKEEIRQENLFTDDLQCFSAFEHTAMMTSRG